MPLFSKSAAQAPPAPWPGGRAPVTYRTDDAAAAPLLAFQVAESVALSSAPDITVDAGSFGGDGGGFGGGGSSGSW